MSEKKEMTLEMMFAQMDGIMEQLDDKELPLEDAFALYAKGVNLIRLCNEKLDKVEKQMLMIEKNGELVPFED